MLALQKLVQYMDGKTTKTEVINQLDSIATPDVDKVVKALELLDRTVVASRVDLSPLKEAVSELKKLPKEYPKFPEQLSKIEVTNQVDNTKQFEKLEQAIKGLKLEAPKVDVKVPETKVVTQNVDLKPLQTALLRIVNAIQAQTYPEIPKTDLTTLEKESKETNKKLTEANKNLQKIIDKPMGGGGGGSSSSFVNSAGNLVYPVLTVDGKIPVDSGAGGGLTDAELRATPVPVSGSLTVDTTGLATSAKQDTLLTELQLKADLTETQPVSIASVPSHPVTNAGTFVVQNNAATPAGNNNIGDVDVATLPVAFNTGTRSATTQRVTVATDDLVPISAASLPLPTGAATAANQLPNNHNVVVTSAPTTAVTGPLTDTQLRATPVPVSGTVTANLAAGTNNIGDVDIVTLPVAFNTGVRSATTQRVTIATDDSVPVTNAGIFAVQASGNVAHDAVDSGNPVKIGGKVSTSTPTNIANAQRVDAWFDEFGRQVVTDRDPETGLSQGTTALRDRLVAQRYTVLSDSIADGLASFWTTTTATGGTVTVTGGEGLLQTSAAAGGTAQLSSTVLRYYPGQVTWLNSAFRFEAGVTGNTRRLGAFTVSGTTPQDGYAFELSGATLNAVVYKAGVATSTTASTSWSRFVQSPFTLDTSYHSFEIRYTANSANFLVDNIVRHSYSGGTTAATTTLNFPMTLQNINGANATNVVLGIRNIGMGRFGAPPTEYIGGQALADQVGAAAVQTFTFSTPVDFIWVTDIGATTTNVSRVDPFGGTPAATTGIPVLNGAPTPINVVPSSATVKVYAPVGSTITMYGLRLT